MIKNINNENMIMHDEFTPEEIILCFDEFKKICKLKVLNKNSQNWLNSWSLWDLSCSPMEDKDRRLIRYGHYLGWFGCNDYLNKGK
jgi:hypothetical protein